MGVLSHDLRNPLNVAAGNLDLVTEGCGSEYLEPIGDALDRMENLIESMLDSLRAGEPVTEIEPIELETFTETCWRNVATGDTTVVIESERTIRANPPRVAQLLENLFRKAIEHSGDAVTITIGDLDDGAGFYEDQGLPSWTVTSRRYAMYDLLGRAYRPLVRVWDSVYRPVSQI